MTTSTISKSKPVQEDAMKLINYDEGVKPENRKQLNRAKDRVRLALQIVDDISEFNDQFEKLLNYLGTWIRSRRELISKAFLTIRDSELLFLVIRNDVKFNMSFDDQLCNLALEVARNPDFGRVRIIVLALPNVSLDSAESFIAPFRMEYVGPK